MGPARKVTCSLLAVPLLLGLLEGGSRLTLAVLGEGPPPIALAWSEPTQGADPDELRDTLYVPNEHAFFVLRPHLDLAQTTNPRIFDLRTNAHGFRGPELDLAQDAGSRRILCLGDSCTFGSGAGDAGTYPAQLEAELEGLRAGLEVEVINTGVPGFTSYQGRRLLEEYGWELEPDVVIIAFGFNDSSAARAGSKRPFPDELGLSDREFGDLLAPPSAWGIVRLAERLRGAGRPDPAPDDPRSKQRVSVDEYRENLESIVAACREHAALPVVVVWPLRSQASARVRPEDALKDELVPPYQAAARAVGAREDVLLLDLVPHVEGRASDFVDRVHMNAQGYAHVARRLARELLPRLSPAK
jgi:lysophospholipase L1-like esterase